MKVQGDGIELRLNSLESTRQRLATMPDEFRANLSPGWLQLVENATEPNQWVHGFAVFRTDKPDCQVGECGFKGPPDSAGMVEIAYQTFPQFEGCGYATEVAKTLTAFAFSQADVNLVRAHTLPETNASTRILGKCGFKFCGDIIDPDDGPVWRWELDKSYVN